MAWSESDDFADASAVAKGLNMLGMGLLLACGGIIVSALLGFATAQAALFLGYAGAIGTVGIAFKAAAYWLAGKEIAERGVKVDPSPRRDMRSLIEELAVSKAPAAPSVVEFAHDELGEEPEAIEERRFVAMLEDEERRNGAGRGV
jgi:hypothetical protein